MRSNGQKDNTSVFYHWTKTPMKLVPRSYEQAITAKPNGLWFDVNEDWVRWCQDNQWGLDRLVFRHKVEITDWTRILKLCTADDLFRFTSEYQSRDYSIYQCYSICWPEVANTFSGIIIAPYIWDCRLNNRARWYYGWDCASGCVWDVSIIRLSPPDHIEVTK